MDFPLIPSRSSHLPFREKTDLLPQPSPESSPPLPVASTQPIFIKGFSPIGNTLFIDVEFQEVVDQLDLPNQFPRWPDFRLRNAFSQYHNVAKRNRRDQHTIVLYA